MNITTPYPKAILGIDVSKSKLDCHLIPDESSTTASRSRASSRKRGSSVKSYRRTVSNAEASIVGDASSEASRMDEE